jgi:hypothetical protein
VVGSFAAGIALWTGNAGAAEPPDGSLQGPLIAMTGSLAAPLERTQDTPPVPDVPELDADSISAALSPIHAVVDTLVPDFSAGEPRLSGSLPATVATMRADGSDDIPRRHDAVETLSAAPTPAPRTAPREATWLPTQAGGTSASPTTLSTDPLPGGEPDPSASTASIVAVLSARSASPGPKVRDVFGRAGSTRTSADMRGVAAGSTSRHATQLNTIASHGPRGPPTKGVP